MSGLLPHEPHMIIYSVEVLGSESKDPVSYYRVTAGTNDSIGYLIALLMAHLVDQYIDPRPTDPRNPMELEEICEVELAKQYCKLTDSNVKTI